MLPMGTRLELASLEVAGWDPSAGVPCTPPLALRWYDDAVPYSFPECEHYIHGTDGLTQTFELRPRWGDFYNLQGQGRGGRLVWIHTQHAEEIAHYRVRARLRADQDGPLAPAPRGFVGDGSHRCAAVGSSTTGLIHSRVAVSDWDADGRLDLLVGCARGAVLLYPNLGTPQQPSFVQARLLTTNDGRPLDVGWSAAPLAVDWDGDGLCDLLCGAERNRVLFFRNLGDGNQPRLVNQGFVHADGQPIELPVEPVPKSPPGVYTLDYYPVLEVVDWNGDGMPDLLAGGYITGRIYLYQAVGAELDGTPKLAARGPLEADGRPLNVGDWAAAPCAADFDNDGDLDLITGSLPLDAGGGDGTDPEHFLRYFENIGTAAAPRLSERKLSIIGRFPAAVLSTPRAADMNADGLLDLVVSANEHIYIYYNTGTAHAPRFAVHADPLPGVWSSAPLPTFGLQCVDWNEDGRIDLFSALTLRLRGPDGSFTAEPLLAPDNHVEHPAPHGDAWLFTQLADLQGDGRLDLLFGTHQGEVWLHANLGGQPPRFDEAGMRLMLEDGTPLRVGTRSGQDFDFDALQGARTTFAVADFDGDERLDLVVGDTYGAVRFFRNTGTRHLPRFAAPVLLGRMATRMAPTAADWDADGLVDVVGGAANGDVCWWRNLGNGAFAAEQSIAVPQVPYGASVVVADWNGDGDADLLVGTAYGYCCWFERSFLKRGYAQAQIIATKIEP